MKTLKLRIRDKHINQLNRLSGSVNFVWNYVNALSYEHLKRTGKFFSAYDLNEYTKGSGEYHTGRDFLVMKSIKLLDNLVGNKRHITQ